MHRHIASWLVLAALAFAAPGCGGGTWSYPVVGTRRDPGAEGTIQVEAIEGGNRLVTASLRHMTPPERFGGNLRTFIMWFKDRRGHSTKASRLSYDPDSRTARATATTPMTRFVLLVTAERNANVAEPSEHIVFQRQVSAQ